MSWDATLSANIDGHAHCVGDWNYTHNCNAMANLVAKAFAPTLLKDGAKRWWTKYERPDIVAMIEADDLPGSWWQTLDDLSGEESFKFLDLIVGGLMEAPAMFREMNPENGWGDYDSLVAVLVAMRDRAKEYPSATWSTSG